MVYDIAIIGSGPAGLSAAIYGKRAGLDVLVLDASPLCGGQILNTYEVDNYPGIPGVTGAELAEKMKFHAQKHGAEFKTGRVSSIKKSETTFELVTRKGNYEALSVIVATGSASKKLGCKGEEDFSGLGVSYCATCDGAFFAGKTVAVVGGGDVALEDAIFLSRSCKKVYIILRRDQFRGTPILVSQAQNTDNIEIIYNSIIDEIYGEECVKGIKVRNKIDENITNIFLDGVFVAVGSKPNSTGIEGLPALDTDGYIIAGEDCKTDIPGIFAAGDVRTKQLRQVVTATADGANSVTSIQKFLSQREI